MSEAAPAHPVIPPDQASVEVAASAADQATAPAVDESAQASPPLAEPAPSTPPVTSAAPDAPAPAVEPAPEPTLEELKAELEGVYSRLQYYDAENTHLKEQLALHSASNAVDAAAALKQIAALAAPFA